MKKFYLLLTAFLLIGTCGMVKAQEPVKSHPKSQQEVTTPRRHHPKKMTAADSIKNAQRKEQSKKEIEAREQKIDKNQKVKRKGVDENLPETIKKRHIP